MQPPPAPLLPRARYPETAQDWEPRKEMIANLYQGMELREVMEIMKDQYNFAPTYVEEAYAKGSAHMSDTADRLPYMISFATIKLYDSKSSLTTYP